MPLPESDKQPAIEKKYLVATEHPWSCITGYKADEGMNIIIVNYQCELAIFIKMRGPFAMHRFRNMYLPKTVLSMLKAVKSFELICLGDLPSKRLFGEGKYVTVTRLAKLLGRS